MTEANLASALVEAGRCREAAPRFAHALDVFHRTKDPRHGMMLAASAMCDLDDPARAVSAITKYQAGITTCEKLGCPQDLTFGFRFGLGAALYRSRRDIPGGLRRIREARAEAVKSGIQPVVNDIDTWAKKYNVRL